MRLSALIVPLTVPAPSHGAVVPPLTLKVPENWRSVCEVIDQTSVQLVEMLAAPDVNTSRREPDQPPIRLGVEGGSVALVGELPPQPGTIRSDSASKAVALIADDCTSHAPIRHASATANTMSDSACRCGLAAPRAAARVSHALYDHGSVTYRSPRKRHELFDRRKHEGAGSPLRSSRCGSTMRDETPEVGRHGPNHRRCRSTAATAKAGGLVRRRSRDRA